MSFRIEHRIGVAAPPEEVWALVYDLAGWPDWTGVYSEAGGKIAIGEELHFTFQVGQRPPMKVIGRVFDWVPEAQLAWTVSFARGWVKSLRYVEIEKLSETSCILANGDIWSGPLAWTFPRGLRADARAAFQRMNENAKAIVEARWAEKGGQALVTPDPEPIGGFQIQPLMKPTQTKGPAMWGLNGKGAGFGPRLMK